MKTRLATLSHCFSISVWICICLYTFTRVGPAAAEIIAVPEASWDAWLLDNAETLGRIDRQLNRLYRVRNDCPTGNDPDPVLRNGQNLTSSLRYYMIKLRLALAELDDTIAAVQLRALPDEAVAYSTRLLRSLGFTDADAAVAARDMLAECVRSLEREPDRFDQFLQWIDRFPDDGPTDVLPEKPRIWQILAPLAAIIDGIDLTAINQASPTIQIDTDHRQAMMSEFANLSNVTSTTAEQMADARALATDAFRGKFWQYKRPDFTVADVFGDLKAWFECWHPPLQELSELLEDGQLSPLPREQAQAGYR
ncbi:hypothetical protein Dda_3287 [Drechslerella dactyloides]|uniref:Uncharacterized protein n=1 Tax=Drechslerella dactyloides TaxID=74499 RepID=A0AAD6NMQ0_DREDA|nr:hypothetical protein Dda_3287 [Drechslerella dactyloides]